MTVERAAPERATAELAGAYLRFTCWVLLALAGLWAVGIEPIWRHFTPFYALFSPAFDNLFPALFVLGLMGLAGRAVWRLVFARAKSRVVARMLLAVSVGIIGLSLVLAALADGGILTGLAALGNAVWRHALLLAVFCAALGLLLAVLQSWRWPWGRELSRREVACFLAALIAFSAVFAAGMAALRGGADGISQAYERQRYEYISDIGKGRSIHGLLQDYNQIHPHLSMHSRVHPPGPVIMLWIMSLVVFSQSPMALSLATIAVGATGLIPLYLFGREMLGQRTALVACLLYALVPSAVLFTATSADILFPPLTLTALWLFWRALHGPSAWSALAAGAVYALMSLTSFSLIGVGAFFGFVGLWRLRQSQRRLWVITVAGLMLIAFFGVHLAVRWWSGFDVIECFRLSKTQFDLDQALTDEFAPRYAAWTFRFFNPLAWLVFAGLPVSYLFLWRLSAPGRDTKALFIVFALTLAALDLLYIARGEGERSGLYIIPFIALPAAHALEEWTRRAGGLQPIAITLVILGFQCWITESLLYTYW